MPTKGDDYVGRAVAKAFPGYGSKKFPGIVTKVDKIDGIPMYRINYDDGDAEHVDKDELLEILAPDSAALAANSGQKRKREPPSARKYERMSLGGVSKSKSKPKDKVKEKRKSKGHGAAVEGEAAEEAAQDAAPARESESERIIVRGAARYVPDAMASPPASSWVKTGNLVFVSDIVGWSRPDTINTQEPAKEVIEAQTRDVLAELEQRLQQAGIANPKESLVSLHVALKDAEGDGRTVFVDEFGEWLGTASPPAITLVESFLGTPERLIAVSAVAAM